MPVATLVGHKHTLEPPKNCNRLFFALTAKLNCLQKQIWPTGFEWSRDQ